MSMVETGIPGLDELLSLNDGEGFPQNTTTLVYGPPKVGKYIFSYHLPTMDWTSRSPVCT